MEVARGSSWAWSPLWSPDGSKLAYQGPPGGYDLHVVNADGSSDIDLSGSSPDGVGGGVYDYAWSPDGSRLVFSFGIDQGHLEFDIESAIFVVNVDGSYLTRLTDAEVDNRQVAWSPSGDRIAFSSTRDGSYDIYTIAPDGTDRRQLTHGDSDKTNTSPVWSPDGDVVYYTHGRYRRWGSAIWSMHADGSHETEVWRLHRHSGEWVLSPDGEKLLANQYDPETGYYQLFLLSSDGGVPERISEVEGDLFDPAWSPDGEQVAYVAKTGRGWHIYVRDVDGGGAKRVTRGRGMHSPEWQPAKS